jgi:hypothetical protein
MTNGSRAGRGFAVPQAGNLLAAAGCVLTFLCLFTPWVGAHLYYVGCTACSAPGGSKNGFDGVGLLVILVLVVNLALLVVRFRGTPQSPAGLAFLATGVVQVILVFVFSAEFHTVKTGGQLTPEFGFYGELIAGVLIGAGGLLSLRGRTKVTGPVSADPFAAPGTFAAGPVSAGNGTVAGPAASDPFAPPPASPGPYAASAPPPPPPPPAGPFAAPQPSAADPFAPPAPSD